MRGKTAHSIRNDPRAAALGRRAGGTNSSNRFTVCVYVCAFERVLAGVRAVCVCVRARASVNAYQQFAVYADAPGCTRTCEWTRWPCVCVCRAPLVCISQGDLFFLARTRGAAQMKGFRVCVCETNLLLCSHTRVRTAASDGTSARSFRSCVRAFVVSARVTELRACRVRERARESASARGSEGATERERDTGRGI